MPVDQIGYNNREELVNELQLRLADGMVDVELDRAHYDIAIDKSLALYRQLSAGAVEESALFITTQEGVLSIHYQTKSWKCVDYIEKV